MFHIECNRASARLALSGGSQRPAAKSVTGRCIAAAHAGRPESHRFSNIESWFLDFSIADPTHSRPSPTHTPLRR